jgi:hypothetical protein
MPPARSTDGSSSADGDGRAPTPRSSAKVVSYQRPRRRSAGAELKQRLKQCGRPLVFAARRRRARRLAAEADRRGFVPSSRPVAFIVGCGRSGTTILGRLLGRHPGVSYHFEPYHLWGAIDERTDITHLLFRGDTRCVLGPEAATEAARARFNHIFLHQGAGPDAGLVMDKTPINAMRLGFLDALAPHARYVHISRDAVDVVRSIVVLATTNSYRVMGRPRLNQWWGDGGVKWDALKEDGIAAGCLPDLAASLHGHPERGAYEWLMTHREVDRWRDHLGSRLHDVTFTELRRDPRAVLDSIRAFLDLPDDPAWLDEAASSIGNPPPSGALPPILPEALAEAVHAYQERFGFPGRFRTSADEITTDDEPAAAAAPRGVQVR